MTGDLFDFLPEIIEQRQAAAARRAVWSQPATCPSCGTVERTGYQLQNNHGYSPEDLGRIYGFPAGQHPAFGAQCMAQHLVSNHIRYAVRHEDAVFLANASERGRELRLDVEAIIAATEAERSTTP